MNAVIERNDLFQAWLVHMDDAIAEFAQFVPKQLSRHFDGSVASLDELESWLLSRYESVAAAKRPEEAKVLDGAARYFGEVLRERSGSKWRIDLSDPKFVFFGIPILCGGNLGETPVCPLTSVTASLDRRTGRFFSTIVGNFTS